MDWHDDPDNPNAKRTDWPVYTMDEVAQHNTDDDIWTVVDGEVFDLTQWRDRHEGGPSMIEGMAGVDASAEFHGMHGDAEAANILIHRFKIGDLAQG